MTKTTFPSEPTTAAQRAQAFEVWFLANYPPRVIITRPDWHAPKIYRAATQEAERRIAELERERDLLAETARALTAERDAAVAGIDNAELEQLYASDRPMPRTARPEATILRAGEFGELLGDYGRAREDEARAYERGDRLGISEAQARIDEARDALIAAYCAARAAARPEGE